MSSSEPEMPAVRPSHRLLLGLVTFALLFAAAGYAWLGHPAGLAHAPGAAPVRSAGDAGHLPDAAQFESMVERLAERLKSRPDDAEGWALLSRSYAVLGQFEKAVAGYRHLLALRPEDAQARAELDELQQRAAPGASLQVRVSLAPELAARASPDDSLFVFARAAQGPKAPLAIQRRQVKELPLTLTLDDSMAMNPALKLSSVEQVVVGARISRSGNAMPQPGDMQALSQPLKVGSGQVQLQIKDRLP